MDSPTGTSGHERLVSPGTWHALILGTWVLSFLALIALTVSSRTIGRSVWWLGPGESARPPWTIVVPIVIAFVPMAAAFLRSTRTSWTSAGASVVLGLATLPDIADRPVVAGAVGLVAFASLLTSVAVIVGERKYR